MNIEKYSIISTPSSSPISSHSIFVEFRAQNRNWRTSVRILHSPRIETVGRPLLLIFRFLPRIFQIPYIYLELYLKNSDVILVQRLVTLFDPNFVQVLPAIQEFVSNIDWITFETCPLIICCCWQNLCNCRLHMLVSFFLVYLSELRRMTSCPPKPSRFAANLFLAIVSYCRHFPPPFVSGATAAFFFFTRKFWLPVVPL